MYIIVIDMQALREAEQKRRNASSKPPVNDFRRLNKAVLREGATNSAVSNNNFFIQDRLWKRIILLIDRLVGNVHV